MDFTREPIIETVITPREGCKLVIRSSKSVGQEEYFVDAVEVVSFGKAFFFRSLERPKAFILPVADYEVLEVREARMVLKNVGLERSIKIAGGRDKPIKETPATKSEVGFHEERKEPALAEAGEEMAPSAEKTTEARVDRKRDRRRQYRRRRGREEKETEASAQTESEKSEKIELPLPQEVSQREQISAEESASITSSLLSSLLIPPPTLIRETIGRYRENDLFKDAFFEKGEEEKEEGEETEGEQGEKITDTDKEHSKVQDLLAEEDEEEDFLSNSPTEYTSFFPQDEEEEIFRIRSGIDSGEAEPIEELLEEKDKDILPGEDPSRD